MLLYHEMFNWGSFQIYQSLTNALISFLLFLIRWQNLLLFLLCFEWWVLSLIDWFVYVTIILIVLSSVNVAHAKSGSTIPQNSGLILCIFGVMFCGAWRIFCFGFVVIQVIVLVTFCPFIQEEHQLLLLQCYQKRLYHC